MDRTPAEQFYDTTLWVCKWCLICMRYKEGEVPEDPIDVVDGHVECSLCEEEYDRKDCIYVENPKYVEELMDEYDSQSMPEDHELH